MLDVWPGEERTFHSADEPDEDADGADLFPPEVLNTFNSGCLPPHNLKLKPGVIIMLLRNMNPAKGLMNGTRLVVLRMTDRLIQARILSGPAAGTDAMIPRIPMRPSDSGQVPVVFTRTQFPLRPAFAMTINKAQGQTLEREWGLTFRSRCFLTASFTWRPHDVGNGQGVFFWCIVATTTLLWLPTTPRMSSTTRLCCSVLRAVTRV